jgi:hypothetical protein
MSNRQFTPEVPTTQLFIPTVIERTPCKRHGADKGQPCGNLGPYHAICNARAKRAGFNAPISEKSLRMNRFKR